MVFVLESAKRFATVQEGAVARGCVPHVPGTAHAVPERRGSQWKAVALYRSFHDEFYNTT